MSALVEGRDRFFAVLKREFAPRLRAAGFRGSGQNFRRRIGETSHAIYVQADKYGGRCALNAGVHFAYLPTSFEGPLPDPRQIREIECQFRCRIAPRGGDYWWDYGATARESVASARHLIETFFVTGESLFARYASADDFVAAFPPSVLRDKIWPKHFWTDELTIALAMARIHRHRGDHALARRFARWGMANLGGTTGLRPGLKAILAD